MARERVSDKLHRAYFRFPSVCGRIPEIIPFCRNRCLTCDLEIGESYGLFLSALGISL